MHTADDQVIAQCPSARTLTSKDHQWTIDLYGTDYLTSTAMPCDLAAGHRDRHLHKVITQYLPGIWVLTQWASWDESEGGSYALFEAPACTHYGFEQQQSCGGLNGHEGDHIFPDAAPTIGA